MGFQTNFGFLGFLGLNPPPHMFIALLIIYLMLFLIAVVLGREIKRDTPSFRINYLMKCKQF